MAHPMEFDLEIETQEPAVEAEFFQEEKVSVNPQELVHEIIFRQEPTVKA